MNLSEITFRLSKLDNWSLARNSIFKEFEFEGFTEAITFVNDVAEIAEKYNHHPDISIQFKRVSLNLTTHSAGGLTEKDFELAEEIDSLNR